MSNQQFDTDAGSSEDFTRPALRPRFRISGAEPCYAILASLPSEKEMRAWCLTALNDYALRMKLPVEDAHTVLTNILGTSGGSRTHHLDVTIHPSGKTIR